MIAHKTTSKDHPDRVNAPTGISRSLSKTNSTAHISYKSPENLLNQLLFLLKKGTLPYHYWLDCCHWQQWTSKQVWPPALLWSQDLRSRSTSKTQKKANSLLQTTSKINIYYKTSGENPKAQNKISSIKKWSVFVIH